MFELLFAIQIPTNTLSIRLAIRVHMIVRLETRDIRHVPHQNLSCGEKNVPCTTKGNALDSLNRRRAGCMEGEWKQRSMPSNLRDTRNTTNMFVFYWLIRTSTKTIESLHMAGIPGVFLEGKADGRGWW
jgi:hypothetical protein